MSSRGKEFQCLFDTSESCDPGKCGMYGWNRWAKKNVDGLTSQQSGEVDREDEAITLSRLAELQERENIYPPCPHSPDPDAHA